MRTKEDAADYRYFPDPDLPPLVIGRDWVEKTRSEMSELPRVMAARFVKDYGLPEYDAGQLTQSKATAAYFEAVAKATEQPKLASNWIMGEVSRRLNAEEKTIENCPLRTVQLSSLIRKIADGTISNNAGKQVFDQLWTSSVLFTGLSDEGSMAYAINLNDSAEGDDQIEAIIKANDLEQMSDTSALEKIIDDVLTANAKNVAEFKAGNAKAFNALVGQAMKATQGKANPAQVNALLKTKLG